MTIKFLGTGIDLGSQQIDSVLDPTSAQDAATKAYVDTLKTQLYGGASRTQKPFCSAYLTSDLTCTNTTDTSIGGANNFTTNVDTDTIYNTSNSQFTLPIAGKYRIHWKLIWDSNTTGKRVGHILLNGTSVTGNSIGADIVGASISAGEPVQHDIFACPSSAFSAGDVIRLYLWQDSGGTRTMTAVSFGNNRTSIEIEWLRP